ncbi:hypothetical protein K493DRAFT_341833 [Basidiobolus meristosporus CBS 931.73]|uniref:RING-type domain-containing protein n=1 Tax=Basidiobolus meristosporus CBS 931.73 TaxID=1314790 RepID=A0A1Y1XIH3_9FUNG|nr:hypothetical protein K493DRAFT_341833 [Basidiobolus meristosporus CBS 931.73]|eukprot:ORX85164.1 hypothetical protein K493DRAFT_341833 [Basidiobolus meristosporus CBS 931.73]
MILKRALRSPWACNRNTLSLVYLILSLAATSQADLFGPSQPIIRQEVVYYLTNATVVRLDKTTPSFEYSANIKQIPATPNPPKDGLQGLLYLQNDPCITQDSSGSSPALSSSNLGSISRVALLPLSNCTIEWKVMRAQNDKALAAIIFSESREPLNLDSLSFPSPVVIPIFVVDPEVGIQLFNDLTRPSSISNGNTTSGDWVKKLRVTLYPHEHFFPGIWEFTLIIVVVLLILSLATSVAMHCHLYRLRRNYAQRTEATENTEMTVLHKGYLDSLPILLYNSEQHKTLQRYSHVGQQEGPPKLPNTMHTKLMIPPALYLQQDRTTQASHTSIESNPVCAICLEDFVDGEEIRQLPCHHDYHVTCIDPWLTTKSGTCPMCKCRVPPPSTTTVPHEEPPNSDRHWFSSITSMCGPCAGMFS